MRLPFQSLLLSSILWASVTGWAKPNVAIEVDRSVITEGETISLKFIVRSEERLDSVGEPKYRAPDFDEVNEFNAVYNESFYENGRFGLRRRQQITKVLRPKKSGNLLISGLSIRVQGRTFTGDAIRIRVRRSSFQSTPYGRRQESQSGGGAAKAEKFFLRAEVPKRSVYKGEQLTVSYYLYRSVPLIDTQIKKFPVLKGFLREDLEMPILGRRLDADTVIVQGAAYQKSLVARYAAYALVEGTAEIDPIALKIHYQPRGQRGSRQQDDPFLRFFRQMTPRAASVQSDPVKIQVKPLPAKGRPANFSGAVGDFSITSSLDRYRLDANDALTFRLKIEGRGNAAAVRTPEVAWPKGVDLYETKGSPRSSEGGISEKVFEYLLIPRRAGKFVLPPVDFSYFDPNLETYLTVSTEPFEIEVSPAKGAASSTDAPLTTTDSVQGSTEPEPRVDPMQELPSEVAWASLLSFVFRYQFVALIGWLLSLIGLQFLRSANDRRKHRLSLIRRRPSDFVSGWKKVVADLRPDSNADELAGVLRDLVARELQYWSGQSVRSMPGAELSRFLVRELGVKSEDSERLVETLEKVDAWKYSRRGFDLAAGQEKVLWLKDFFVRYESAFRQLAESRARQESSAPVSANEARVN